jgi:hypothetical protein
MVFSSALSQKIQNILSKLRYSYDGQYTHAKKVLLLIFLLYILGICCIYLIAQVLLQVFVITI